MEKAYDEILFINIICIRFNKRTWNNDKNRLKSMYDVHNQQITATTDNVSDTQPS